MPRIKRFNQESQAWEYVDQNTIPEINITHETGSSENKLMSQKIVTDELNKKQEKGNYALKSDLPTKTSELINDSGFVDTGLGIENATVGQIVRIKAVDDLGNPTKLETINSPNAVLYDTQTLTPAQQEQARKNIGVSDGSGIWDVIADITIQDGDSKYEYTDLPDYEKITIVSNDSTSNSTSRNKCQLFVNLNRVGVFVAGTNAGNTVSKTSLIYDGLLWNNQYTAEVDNGQAYVQSANIKTNEKIRACQTLQIANFDATLKSGNIKIFGWRRN